MALSFLKDRDENAVLGNLGAFTGGGARGQSVQTALAIYRKDQKSHHEQSIASDLTRGLLRKTFRDTVLESSKQVKRKYSYSAVGSTVQEDIDAANMGIMAKLKKLQKERLIVARLGFPDKAMEIDEHIEQIRADLRSERETVDARILEDALVALALQHQDKLLALETELKKDENKVRGAFEQERATILGKQEKQFVQLVDDAIKRAIGKSKSCSCAKKYLCHHNKTASFNTRRPKKEVIHFRKNAKRLRHGGRLEESAAWEEKAAELDADHLDKWREEVAASLTASAWGGSSSALDQLASQHQREISRMETAQANEWTLMQMRHRTARRNCHNAIMVEQKKLRVGCKKSAEERHRREMLGEADPTEGDAAVSGDPDEDVAGMLRTAINDEDSTTEDKEEGQAREKSVNGVAVTRPPTRPSSAPPARGKRPQLNAGNNENNQQTSASSAAASAAAAADGEVTHGDEGASVDDDSFGKDSHDLRGFDELEGEAGQAFSYDEYPAAGSPEEPEWLHTPWYGTNSADIPVLDKVVKTDRVGGHAPTVARPVPRLSTSAPPPVSSSKATGGSAGGEDSSSFVEHSDAGGSSTRVEKSANSRAPCREGRIPDDGGGVNPGVTIELLPVARGAGEKGFVAAVSPLSVAGSEGKEEDRGCGWRSPRRASGAVSSPRVIAGGGELKRYDWGGADAVPTKPALFVTSRLPVGNRADKQRFRNAKKKNANQKTVSWGENVEVPPESDDDEYGTDNGEEGYAGDDGEGSGEDASNLDAIADGFVDDDFLKSDDDDDDNDDGGGGGGNGSCRNKEKRAVGHTKDLSVLSHLEESPREQAIASNWTAARASDTRKVSDRETDRKGEDVSEERADSGHSSKSGARNENDGRPDERDTVDIDRFPARSKKRRALSVEERPSATEEESSLSDNSASDHNRMQEHPLQRALDQFSLILALHGDWLSLLGQIIGHEVCRKAFHRWGSEHRWREQITACYTADLGRGADGRVLSWGSARARAAAETVACSTILAPFIASPAARRMVHSQAGRKAIGGRTIAEEPALGRSRRPWRTLFERVLGSLPYGAVLSLTQASRNSDGCGEKRTLDGEGAVEATAAGAAAGKILWANESFEKLAGVDAVDIVGQEICSLFDEDEAETGEGEEGEGEGRGELKRSLELGKKCALWMSMAAQQDGFTDVLCLHQTVAVPPQLSGEGRYSVLMLFDTASVFLESPEQGGRGWGGQVEGTGGGPATQPGQEKGGGFDQEEKHESRERSRKQACHDLSKAMAILLGDGDTGVDDDQAEGKGNGPSVDSRESKSPSSDRNNDSDSFALDETRGVGREVADARDNEYLHDAEREGDPEQHSSTLETLPSLNCESDDLSRYLHGGDLDGELLEARLARACGIEDELRGDSLEELPLSGAPRTSGHGGRGQEEGVEEEKEEHATTRYKEQHQQHVQPAPPPHSAAENDAAEYSSGDDSSAPPRVDLLLSPHRSSTPEGNKPSTDEELLARETIRNSNNDSSDGGTTVGGTLVAISCIPTTGSGGTDYGRNHAEAENKTAIREKKDQQGGNNQDTSPRTVDRGKATASSRYDDATQSIAPRILRLSLDGYEDDFCDDEDESASLAQPEAKGEGNTGKGLDAAAGNDNNLDGMENRSDMIRGGSGGRFADRFDRDGNDDYPADGYSSSTSDGVYSGTAAGGLEDKLHVVGGSDGVGYGSGGNSDVWWGDSLEGGVDEGDVWGIRSPPRSTYENHQGFSSRNSCRSKVYDGNKNHHNNHPSFAGNESHE